MNTEEYFKNPEKSLKELHELQEKIKNDISFLEFFMFVENLEKNLTRLISYSPEIENNDKRKMIDELKEYKFEFNSSSSKVEILPINDLYYGEISFLLEIIIADHLENINDYLKDSKCVFNLTEDGKINLFQTVLKDEDFKKLNYFLLNEKIQKSEIEKPIDKKNKI